jgi:hypothetical protein
VVLAANALAPTAVLLLIEAKPRPTVRPLTNASLLTCRRLVPEALDVPTKRRPDVSIRANSLDGPLTRSGTTLVAALIVNVESGAVSPIPTRCT